MLSYGKILALLEQVMLESGSASHRVRYVCKELSRSIARAEHEDHARELVTAVQQRMASPMWACDFADIESRVLSAYPDFKKEVTMPNEEPKTEKPANPAVAMLQREVDNLEASLVVRKNDLVKAEKLLKDRTDAVAEIEAQLAPFKKALKKIS